MWREIGALRRRLRLLIEVHLLLLLGGEQVAPLLARGVRSGGGHVRPLIGWLRWLLHVDWVLTDHGS